MNRNPFLTVVILAAAVLILGCAWQTISGKNKDYSGMIQIQKTAENSLMEKECVRQLFAMDTYMTFTAYGEHAEQAVNAAMEEVKRLDALLSIGIESSEVSRLNQEGILSVSEDTRELLKRSIEIYEKTDGVFDFTIYPLMKLWGFTDKAYHVAAEEELKEILPYINAGAVKLNGNEVSLGEGQKIDFGAIAKGYTSAKLMEIFRENGVTSAMVYLGGNVQTLGRKPDGSKWNIGIQNPSDSQGSTVLALHVEDQAVITSGGYERYFEEDGKTYIHILDPKTGYPAENDLISVSIVSSDGTLADALSTSLFLMGEEGAERFWRENKESFQMILITKDGKLHITEGLIPDVTCSEEYETIR